jgi:hypothetical protein
MPRTLLLLAVLACACGQGGPLRGPAPAESTPAPAESQEEGRAPAQLSREEILAGMQTAQRRVRACPVDPGTTSATVAVRVKVAPNGRVSDARILGPMSETPAASCLEREIELIAFRANPGTEFDYLFPLQ